MKDLELTSRELCSRYLNGESARSLAAVAGVSQQTVVRRLVALGVELRPEGQKKLSVPVEELCRRYLAGEGLSDLAAATGLSYQTIGRHLRKAGIPLRGMAKSELARQRMSEVRRAQIPEDELRRLHAEGMSCQEMGDALGWCAEAIRDRLIELGLPRLPGKARPEKNYFWRGGFAVDEQGYILEKRPDHPNADHLGYVRQHRLVMEKMLGRYLTIWEVVDHKNRDTSDNDPSNLELYASNADHLAATLAGRKKLPPQERERLRQEAVRRARQRVAAILAASGNGAGQ